MVNFAWILKAYLTSVFAWGNIALLHNMQLQPTGNIDNLAHRYSQQFLAATDSTNIPTVFPVAETVDEIGLNARQDFASDADDPAIYVHPEDPRQSFVITTFKEGGLRVYDLTGQPIQSISPQNVRYNNVDVAYRVRYQSQMVGKIATVDLAIASDRVNDTLAIFKINPVGANGSSPLRELPLQKITSVSMPESIFGVDDEEATAYGLTAYTSNDDGKTYVFVSQSDSNKIAQLEIQPGLGAADELTINAKIIRTFSIPIPQGLAAKDALVEGMVVDRETEIFYLAQENFGIWKINLDSLEESIKDSGNIVDLVNRIKLGSPLSADIEGLAIYYGNKGQGYLIASSQGDSTFAIYDRQGDNSYLGSFAVEGVKQTDGLDITSTPLGEQYPEGLLIVQDGVNKVPKVSFNLSNNQTQYLKTNFKFISAKDIFENY